MKITLIKKKSIYSYLDSFAFFYKMWALKLSIIIGGVGHVTDF